MACTQHILIDAPGRISRAAAQWFCAAKRAVFQRNAPRVHVIEHVSDGALRVSIPARTGGWRYALLAAATTGLCIGANRIAHALVCNVNADLSTWLPLLVLSCACARLLIDQASAVLTEETLTVNTEGLIRQRSLAGFSLCTTYPAEALEDLRVVGGARPIAFYCGGAVRCGAGLSRDAAEQIVAAMARMHPRLADASATPALLVTPGQEALHGHNAGHDVDHLAPVHALA